MLAVRRSLTALALSTLLSATVGPELHVNAQPPSVVPPSGWPDREEGSAELIDPGLLIPGQEAAGQIVQDVRISGQENVSEDKIISYLRTRKDRQFDPDTVQADKRRLIASGLFREVRIYTQSVDQGVVVTFEVFERPIIRHIRFLGDRRMSVRALQRESGLEVGEALNLYAIQEARRKIESFYRSRGFPYAQVEILEGDAPEDRGVTLQISEGPLQRIASVKFIGNTIASDQRLKSLIQSKPGFLWYLFRGKVDAQKIDEDIKKLTAYYRGLGFFRARISRETEYDADHEWVTLRFVIDEGPRYVVRSVELAGNTRLPSRSLESRLELKEGDHFNLSRMNRDVNTLRDLYGSQGYIFADIQADPRFRFEEPGTLDLIYNVDEGKQFRVGRINIHIAGEFPHTRESVVRNRLSIKTGDIVDIREVRASERRLKASQLFENDPAAGKEPRIVIRPPQLSDAEELIANQSGSSVRGQSPDEPQDGDEIELDIYLPPLAEHESSSSSR